MAEIVGCLAMSHAPQLMLNPEQWNLLHSRSWDPLPERPELQSETLDVRWEKWNRCQAAIEQLRMRLDAFRPDTVVVVGDDQHENLLDDNIPPFTIFIGDEVEASTSLRYLKESLADNRTGYRVDSALAKYLLNGLMDNDFDPSFSKETTYAGGLGHAFARPLRFLTPGAPYAIVPVMVNTYYPPAPSARRCVQLGKTLAKLIHDFPEDRRVVVLGSGGLTHTNIRMDYDQALINAIESNDLDTISRLEAEDLVEGTSEIRNWIVTAAAAGKAGKFIDYQPLYRTTTGVGCAMGFAHWT